MNVLKSIVIVMIALIISNAHSADDVSALVNLHQIDNSKVKGTVTLMQGSALTQVSGAARGLDPFTPFPYGSLVYDLSSVPSGPSACHPQNPTSPPRLLGFWNVNPDGTASLDVQIPGLDVSDIGTLSIRLFIPEQPPLLQACGRVNVDY